MGQTTNLAVIRGRLSSPPRHRTLASGDLLVRYEITVPRQGEPADSVPVSWFGPADPPPAVFEAGEAVVVVGRVRRRFYGTPGGARSSTEVVAEAVLAAADTRRARAAAAKAAKALAP